MSETPLRIIFAGTPDFAAKHLQGLLNSPHQLVAVYTQPDRPAGRGKKLQASPVKQLAVAHNLTVFQPTSLRDEQAQDVLNQLAADIMVVVAYGLILPQAVLDAPRMGCLNVHASLLPRWRGAAPIQRAIEAGDTETGITIMQMDAGLDTGDMLSCSRCAIDADTTAASLHDELAELGVPQLLKVLDKLTATQAAATPQDEAGTTYAEKISKSEAEIDWQRSATELDQAIRAFNPFPVCFTQLSGERVKVWAATPIDEESDATPGTLVRADRDGIVVQCGKGQISIQTLQLPGGKSLSAEQILNARSAQFCPGQKFGHSNGI